MDSYYRLLDSARQQHLLGGYSCVGCRILQCPGTCASANARSSRVINGIYEYELGRIRDSLRSVSRDVGDSGKCYNPADGFGGGYSDTNRGVTGGRCNKLEIGEAHKDPVKLNLLTESAQFLYNTGVQRLARGLPPAYNTPNIGHYSYPAVWNHLLRLMRLSSAYARRTPIPFYIAEDVAIRVNLPQRTVKVIVDYKSDKRYAYGKDYKG